MAHNHDWVVGMTRQDEPQRVCASSDNVLKRLPIGKAYQMRRREPSREELRIFLSNFIVSSELPGAVIDIVEIVADDRCNLAGLRDRVARRDAPAKWTCIHYARLPRGRDTSRDCSGLCATAFSEQKCLATSKSFGLDAFDVTMPDQQDLGHVHLRSAHTRALLRQAPLRHPVL